MKVVTVLGARPQFIKAAPVCHALRAAGHHEVLVHTGQHYDRQMSDVFFEELGIPEPSVNLAVGSGSHARQTAQMLVGIEDVLIEHRPDWLLVYGDTNSTLAGALAACKLGVPIAHVEAGLRSFNRSMPEEHNRVMVDHCADLLFCPTPTAVSHLAREGVTRGVHLVGDTMFDAVLQFGERAEQRSSILAGLSLEQQPFLLATVHRPYNTDDPTRLANLLQAFVALPFPVVFPVHPRTRGRIAELGRTVPGLDRLRMIEPVSYLEMLVLEKHARLVLTDSGGVQKEAFFFGVPCLTLRPETEWVETVEAGMNIVVDTDPVRIEQVVRSHQWPTSARLPGLEPGAADRILRVLERSSATSSL
jgi:UDP-N-acetylglucosamine 2-epimerase